MKRLITALLLSLTIIAPGAAQQSETLIRIAAVVNDDMISVFDLENRIRLAMVTSGVRASQEARERLTPGILRQMITETIQLQEAQRLGIDVTAEEIENAIIRIEQSNGMPRGRLTEMLRTNNVELRAYVQQLRAAIAWNKIVQRQLAGQVNVSEEEVQELHARLQEQSDTFQYQLAEIYLPVDTPEQNENVRQQAERLMEQIRRGADFSSLARQFSQSGTAAVGGDMGELFESQIDPSLRSAVTQMRSGQVMGPIRTVTGYYILFLRSRRTLSGGNPDDTLVTLGQVVFSTEGENRSELARRARELGSASNGCEDFVQRGRQAGARATIDEDMIISRLPSYIRQRIRNVEAGNASSPLVAQDAIAIFMVCHRQAPGLPTEAQLRRTLVEQKLEARARRYIRDLRREATIDIRI